MYIQNNSSFLYSAPDDNFSPVKTTRAQAQESSGHSLENFSEKAILIYEKSTAGMSPEQKEKISESLASIGKAAAFSSINGFDTQNERNVVSQYFGNLSGVVSDETIRKMIHSKLDNPSFENREFFEKFSNELDQPLQGINIKV